MKCIVITGSTRGIGRGLAESFLKKECRVIISGRNETAVQDVVSELEGTFGADRVKGKACEITSLSEVEGLWAFAKASFGTVDVWINNAGMSIERKPLHEQSKDALERIASTNLVGVLLTNKVVVGEMLKQNHGQVWNMDGFGSNGEVAPGMVAYGATKRAVNYVTKALQKEVKGTAVQVCTLSPGIVVTDLLVGDYDLTSSEWQKTKKILNILGDTVETVTPFLVDGILSANKSGTKVAWLTTGKAFSRFMTASFNKRDLFQEFEANS